MNLQSFHFLPKKYFPLPTFRLVIGFLPGSHAAPVRFYGDNLAPSLSRSPRPCSSHRGWKDDRSAVAVSEMCGGVGASQEMEAGLGCGSWSHMGQLAGHQGG